MFVMSRSAGDARAITQGPDGERPRQHITQRNIRHNWCPAAAARLSPIRHDCDRLSWFLLLILSYALVAIVNRPREPG
jgi:hypothetical protein